MSSSRGKEFEAVFRQDWKQVFPDSFLYRLPDMTGGMLGVNNPCDFICFTSPHFFLIECKSHGGASIPFTAMPQYERLLAYKDIKDVHPGFVIWFKDKDKVIWVDIKKAEKIYLDGHKSIQLSMLDKYNLLELPSQKKRVFMTTNYEALVESYQNDII